MLSNSILSLLSINFILCQLICFLPEFPYAQNKPAFDSRRKDEISNTMLIFVAIFTYHDASRCNQLYISLSTQMRSESVFVVVLTEL